jgi:hypothetical protein
MGIFWGFVLVWAGLAYLGASMGWWDYANASELWLYWPLILIFGGLSAILRGSKYAWAVLTFLLLITTYLIYDLSFASTPYLLDNNWRAKLGREVNVREESFELERDLSAELVKYKIKVGAINGDIKGTTDMALVGKFTSNFLGLSRESSTLNKTQLIELTGENSHGPMMWFGRKFQNKLELALTKEVPVALEVDCGASSLDFDLSEYTLSSFTLSAGASDIYLKLGEKIKNGALIEIKGGASATELEIPKNIGARIKSDDGLTANDFQGFTKQGEYYVNEAYESAAIKVDITFQTGASAMMVKQY